MTAPGRKELCKNQIVALNEVCECIFLKLMNV